MSSTRKPALLLGFLVALAALPSLAQPALSDALKAKRPVGGEYLGLYLMGKKVGYMFTDLYPVPGSPDKAESIQEVVFKVNVGGRESQRRRKDIKVYESKPGGRLLSLVIEERGDGGDQTLEGTSTPKGLTVVRKRPNQPNQVLNLPPSKETIEDSDQARVAILRKAKVEGMITDGADLEHYKVTTTPGKTQERSMGGVKVRLASATTLNEKEKVPAEGFFTESGEMVEVAFGGSLRAVAEPKATAMRLDQVEVFGLTRVVLPKLLMRGASQVTLVVAGLPAKFFKNNYRQRFKKLPGEKAEVTLVATPLNPAKKQPRPLADPAGGENLKNTLSVESAHPDIQKLAKTLAADDKDAHEVAKRINAWVYQNLAKDYGASAERASDVLRQKKGDCTEHALLAVALMRAAGIPAKRIDGVVYMLNDDGVPALYWHEWVEAFVGDWTQMDPTFNQPVADATHLAFGEEGNAEITIFGQLQVTEVRDVR